MFHPPQSRILFNAWVGKKHVLLTKNMLFYKSAKQNVRQTDKKAGKKRSKGLKNWHKMVKCVPLCSHQIFKKTPGWVFFIGAAKGRVARRGRPLVGPKYVARTRYSKKHPVGCFFIGVILLHCRGTCIGCNLALNPHCHRTHSKSNLLLKNATLIKGGNKIPPRLPWGQGTYSARFPTDIVMRRIPLLMDFSLFILARIISPV